MSLIAIIIVVILLILVLAIRGAKSPENPAIEKDCQNYDGGSCCCGGGGGGRCREDQHEEEPIVYFDDDELDTLAGRDPETYDEEELELFREIDATIREEEKDEWHHSLKLRGIILPAELLDDNK